MTETVRSSAGAATQPAHAGISPQQLAELRQWREQERRLHFAYVGRIVRYRLRSDLSIPAMIGGFNLSVERGLYGHPACSLIPFGEHAARETLFNRPFGDQVGQWDFLEPTEDLQTVYGVNLDEAPPPPL